MTDILQFPEPPKFEQPETLIGPFEEYRVVVDGRCIPLLTGFPDGEGKTALVLDRRFSITVDNDQLSTVAWFVASALAIGQGYTHVGATSKERPFAPQIGQLGSVPQ